MTIKPKKRTKRNEEVAVVFLTFFFCYNFLLFVFSSTIKQLSFDLSSSMQKKKKNIVLKNVTRKVIKIVAKMSRKHQQHHQQQLVQQQQQQLV